MLKCDCPVHGLAGTACRALIEQGDLCDDCAAFCFSKAAERRIYRDKILLKEINRAVADTPEHPNELRFYNSRNRFIRR